MNENFAKIIQKLFVIPKIGSKNHFAIFFRGGKKQIEKAGIWAKLCGEK